MRSIRKWQLEIFGKTNVIKLFAISTRDDLKCKSEHYSLVDDIILLPSKFYSIYSFHVDGPPNINYANIILISNIAKTKNIDAIYAGWGHIAENHKIHDYLGSDITWIGPSKSAMYDLGITKI